MGELIRVEFGTEGRWERMREKTIEGLVEIGALYGDGEALMTAKGECLYRTLRQMMQEVPAFQVMTELPEDLSPEQRGVVTAAIREAAQKGKETAIVHAVETLLDSIYDLCTSSLAETS
jgi:hypothetical protein